MPTEAELTQDLEDLYVARRAIVVGMAEGKKVIEYQIRGRMARYSEPAKDLEIIREEILFLERKLARSQTGSARNKVSITRRRC